jgi:integrating conjugative element protein (TIGR03761 family)
MTTFNTIEAFSAGDNSTKMSIPREQPGSLRSETTMIIQTRQAQKLIEGRKKAKGVEPIIGVLEFGRRLKLIWLSAEANDPYADWYLVRIEDELNNAKQLISRQISGLQTVMADMKGFAIQVAESLQPVHVSIYFQNPYGYMGAYLVSNYDVLARTVFTARHIGLLDRLTTDRILHETGTAIRRAFNEASGWKFTGVTRTDLEQNNQNAKRAFSLFGECPQAILTEQRRAALAPLIKKGTTVVAQGVLDETAEECVATTDAPILIAG